MKNSENIQGKNSKINIYSLYRNFFDWAFENPDKIKPNHIAIFSFAVEQCNRFGWIPQFGFPTSMAMAVTGIHSYNTYIKAFNDLVEFGFFKLIKKSQNQFTANIIALSNFDEPLDKALDEAMMKHLIKHDVKQRESNDSIIRQSNQLTNKPININVDAPASAHSDFFSNNSPESGNPKNEIAREKKIARTKKFIPPTEEEMINYFRENGYSVESAKKAWKYYEAGNWMDARGNAVRNWKQKALSVWFKPENEKKRDYNAERKAKSDATIERHNREMAEKRKKENEAMGVTAESFKIKHFLDDF